MASWWLNQSVSHRIHVWYIYHIYHKSMANVDKYPLHGASGFEKSASQNGFIFPKTKEFWTKPNPPPNQPANIKFPNSQPHRVPTKNHGVQPGTRIQAIDLFSMKYWLFNKDPYNLVGGFNPFETYARQIGLFPQVGLKIKNIWNHQPVMVYPPENRNPLKNDGWFRCLSMYLLLK